MQCECFPMHTYIIMIAQDTCRVVLEIMRNPVGHVFRAKLAMFQVPDNR